MNLFDMRTIVLSYVITDIICVWFVVLLWRQSRDRFSGTAYWVVDFVFQAAALVLIVLRATVPDWISMVLSNTLVIAGALLGLMGLERFVGKKGPQIYNYLLLILFIFVQSYFTLVQPSLAVRTINLSLALFLICFQTTWLLWRRVGPGLRSLTFGTGLVNFLYCLVSVVRIAHFLIAPQVENDFFRSGLFDALMLFSYQILFILLTYNFILMVNKRLITQIGTQEEKFTKAFHSAPYAITLTRPSDGKIMDVNESFFKITGYDHAEVHGKNTVDLHIWEHDEDRAAVVDALSKTGKFPGKEMRFRRKNGETVVGLFSAEVITIDGEKSILSSIGDITELKASEEKIKASLLEKETMLKEIHHRGKNNLAVISSLLGLQSRYLKDEKSRKIFQESQDRVRVMANIHTLLYQSEDLSRVDFGGFIRDLAGRLQQSYGTATSPIEIQVDIVDVSLPIETSIPCGLILNELVSNALKHAFPEELFKVQSSKFGVRETGTITITLTEQDQENLDPTPGVILHTKDSEPRTLNVEHRTLGKQVVLTVQDNGIGFPQVVDFKNTKSLGLELVNLLVGQINGTIDLTVDGGTKFTITFPMANNKG